MQRPKRISDETEAKILAMLRDHVPPSVISERCGVCERTVQAVASWNAGMLSRKSPEAMRAHRLLYRKSQEVS